MTNEEMLDIVKMRLDGYTCAQIGEKYGTTGAGIFRAIHSIISSDPNWYRAGQIRMYDKIIYPNIRARMEEREWTMRTLSDKTGISRQCLYKVLYSDTLRPRIASMKEIALALDMSVGEAFGKEERNDA